MDILVYHNGTFPGFKVTLSLNGEPVDLTGSTITWVAKKDQCQDAPTVLEGVMSHIDNVITCDEIKNVLITPRQYFHELKVVLSNGTTLYPMNGLLTVKPTLQ